MNILDRYIAFRDVSIALESYAGYSICHSKVAHELIANLQVDLDHEIIGKYVEMAQDKLDHLQDVYPNIAWITKSIMAARIITVCQSKKIEELYESGFLGHADEEHLKELLNKRITEINNFRTATSVHGLSRFPGATRLRKATERLRFVGGLSSFGKRAQVLPDGAEPKQSFLARNGSFLRRNSVRRPKSGSVEPIRELRSKEPENPGSESNMRILPISQSIEPNENAVAIETAKDEESAS
jgi:hypothetical protein